MREGGEICEEKRGERGKNAQCSLRQNRQSRCGMIRKRVAPDDSDFCGDGQRLQRAVSDSAVVAPKRPTVKVINASNPVRQRKKNEDLGGCLECWEKRSFLKNGVKTWADGIAGCFYYFGRNSQQKRWEFRRDSPSAFGCVFWVL
jgi:hypothetical protein